MTAQAIKQMRDEDIIGFHRRMPPFRAKRMTGGISRSLPSGEGFHHPGSTTFRSSSR